MHLAAEWNGKKGDLRGGGGFIAAGSVEGGGSPPLFSELLSLLLLRIGLPGRLFKRAAWRVIAEES